MMVFEGFENRVIAVNGSHAVTTSRKKRRTLCSKPRCRS